MKRKGFFQSFYEDIDTLREELRKYFKNGVCVSVIQFDEESYEVIVTNYNGFPMDINDFEVKKVIA